jgi:protein-tyrosine phosphatase
MRDHNDSDITYFVYSAIDFIEESLKETNGKAKILVHCYQGNSRSVAILACYYIWKKGLTEHQALDFIRSKRGSIDPNIGFVGQMMEFSIKVNSQKRFFSRNIH